MTNPKLTTKQVIEHFGGPTALAEKLSINQSAVSNWLKRGIPAAQALDIEELSNGRFTAREIFRAEVE